ncbi:hypothetical protein H9L39_16190 [Fusarium oxysporum f. sp. albedinis]|nr:hypothetical protein H9L39_16190 [Fusarium oxysporum f. sp. albedinis]
MWPKDYAKGLPKAAPINGRHIRSLYVGVLAINGQLVYISSKKGEVYPNLFEDDDFTGLAFKAEPSQTPAGSNTILIETNLIGGNLAHNKQYVAGQTDSFDSEADPEGKAIRQNEKEGISDMNKFYNKPGIDTHWAIPLIPLGRYTVSLGLITEITADPNTLDPMLIIALHIVID